MFRAARRRRRRREKTVPEKTVSVFGNDAVARRVVLEDSLRVDVLDDVRQRGAQRRERGARDDAVEALCYDARRRAPRGRVQKAPPVALEKRAQVVQEALKRGGADEPARRGERRGTRRHERGAQRAGAAAERVQLGEHRRVVHEEHLDKRAARGRLAGREHLHVHEAGNDPGRARGAHRQARRRDSHGVYAARHDGGEGPRALAEDVHALAAAQAADSNRIAHHRDGRDGDVARERRDPLSRESALRSVDGDDDGIGASRLARIRRSEAFVPDPPRAHAHVGVRGDRRGPAAERAAGRHRARQRRRVRVRKSAAAARIRNRAGSGPEPGARRADDPRRAGEDGRRERVEPAPARSRFRVARRKLASVSSVLRLRRLERRLGFVRVEQSLHLAEAHEEVGALAPHRIHRARAAVVRRLAPRVRVDRLVASQKRIRDDGAPRAVAGPGIRVRVRVHLALWVSGVAQHRARHETRHLLENRVLVPDELRGRRARRNLKRHLLEGAEGPVPRRRRSGRHSGRRLIRHRRVPDVLERGLRSERAARPRD